jgi:mono/diheme cytochrome c family protein
MAAGDFPTKYSNTGTISNTRHNMTQMPADGNGPFTLFMDNVRNDYWEVCVYCHTPHGANPNPALPLWNHSIVSTVYTTYNQGGSATLTQEVSQPGANSLTCLSCHDGQTAIDSVINMPGSDRYLASQVNPTNDPTNLATQKAFLSTWKRKGQAGGGPPSGHQTMAECMSCHTENGAVPGATSFGAFLIGKDLRNDHPIGVVFPTANPDFFQPTGTAPLAKYFDTDGDGHMDKEDIRLYKNGSNFQVECATCHDPHGVPSNGVGSQFNGTFLRKTNGESKVCFTCHNK